MQTLQLHPDLGGEEWDARLINIAYATLRDPKKRAHYDQTLFQKQCIKTVSRGNLGHPSHSNADQPRDKNSSRRHYYRILQVQPDAERAIIEASYKLLKRDPSVNRLLLDEAWKILGNDAKRRHYDKTIKQAARSKNKPTSRHDTPAGADTRQSTETPPPSRQDTKKPGAGKEPLAETDNHHTNPCCSFCKTRYFHNDYAQRHEYCEGCGSPLTPLADSFHTFSRRGINRNISQIPAVIYTRWPGNPIRVSLSDLSPAGLAFVNKKPIEVGYLIKIDAEQFKAVAESRYCQTIGPFFKIGVRFVTIKFQQQRGIFFSSSV